MLESMPQVFASHVITSIMLILVIWIYNTVLSHLEEFEKNRAKDQLLERWEAQYQAAASSQKAISKLEHNLRYQLLTLSGLMNDGDYDGVQKHIDAALGSFEAIINTGNISIDTMLNYYNQKINDELGISLETELTVPSGMKLDAIVIATILGNALENAINACVHVDATKRYIDVKISYAPQGELIFIITNPYTISPILDDAGELQTTKSNEDSHGIGIASMHDILPEELGHINIKYSDNVFRFTLIINYFHA